MENKGKYRLKVRIVTVNGNHLKKLRNSNKNLLNKKTLKQNIIWSKSNFKIKLKDKYILSK